MSTENRSNLRLLLMGLAESWLQGVPVLYHSSAVLTYTCHCCCSCRRLSSANRSIGLSSVPSGWDQMGLGVGYSQLVGLEV